MNLGVFDRLLIARQWFDDDDLRGFEDEGAQQPGEGEVGDFPIRTIFTVPDPRRPHAVRILKPLL